MSTGGSGGVTGSTTSSTTTSTTTTSTGTGPTCGDGVVSGQELCDDGDTKDGDGCGAGCEVEPYYQCRRHEPTICHEEETRCLDGLDGDGDGFVDDQDADCILPAYYPPLACASVWVYRSVDVPEPIPDDSPAGTWSTIVVPDDIAVAHVSVVLSLSHPRDSDLTLTLYMPFGQPRTLSSNNGGPGADYAETVFDSTCSTSVTNGGAPFMDCFKPESFLPNNGQSAKGTWALDVEDQAQGLSGTIDEWTLVICAP